MNDAAKPPVSATDFPEDWVAIRREVIVRDGFALRAGLHGVDLAGEPFTIEIKSLTDNRWQWLALPGNGVRFATRELRDDILKQLTEGAK